MNRLETNIYNARKTILEMMKDRGYDITKHIEDIPLELFIETIADDNLEILFEKDDKTKLVVYFFIEIKSISKKNFKSICDKLISKYEDDNLNIILVFPGKPSSSIKKEIINTPKYLNIQLYQLKHLIINITKHKLQPKFKVLTDDNLKKVCSMLFVPKEQFPKILINDPISRYYGVKPGQVFEIKRQSKSSGEYITYRIVT
jgi:DNA-directed RNA polymerases I, II, and III subunit RPABC1